MMILSSKSTLWLVPRVILRKKKKNNLKSLELPFFFVILFTYLFLVMLGLCCRYFSSFREQELFSSCCVRSSHYCDFAHFRAQALGMHALVVVARELGSCSRRAGSGSTRAPSL